MSKIAKIILAIIGALLLALLGTCGGIYWWFQAHSDELRADAKDIMRDGARFGSGKDAQVCVDEALRRLPATTGIVSEAKNKAFLEACLKVANVTPEFCAGIPPRDEIMRSATWTIEKCAALGKLGDASPASTWRQSPPGSTPSAKPCTRLIGAVQQRCFFKR